MVISNPWGLFRVLGTDSTYPVVTRERFRSRVRRLISCVRYLKSFRPLAAKEEIEFMEARPILYLNMAAVASLFNSRNQNATANRSNWSTIMSYLKSHPSFLGLKQDRFTILLPNGLPDYTIEVSGGQQLKKVKVNRPKALCFDYLQLKDMFGLDLETEMVQDEMDLANEVS